MKILAPVCPGCQQPPTFVLSPEQVFCYTGTCAVFCWNMLMDPIEQWANQNPVAVDLSALEPPKDTP